MVVLEKRGVEMETLRMMMIMYVKRGAEKEERLRRSCRYQTCDCMIIKQQVTVARKS